MAELRTKSGCQRALRQALVAVGLLVGVMVGVMALADRRPAEAGLLAEPVGEPAATTAELAAMQASERTRERARMMDRQSRLDRGFAATTAARQVAERRLRRLAVDVVAASEAERHLDAEIAQRSTDVMRKQRRLEALLAEIVQLSRGETGEPRRLAQLRAIAASLAQPFAAAKAQLAEARAGRRALDDRLIGLAEASADARQALIDAEARAERLAGALNANRPLVAEAVRRADSAAAFAALAERRLDRVTGSRTLASVGLAAPAVIARAVSGIAPRRLQPEALRAGATIAARPVRSAAHFDLPEMAAAASASGGRGSMGNALDGGRLVPVAGAVVSRFGEGQKPPFDRGLTIEVEDRRLVRAPRDGRVVFARAYEGFGLLLIIDHGDEYHSLLSGLSRFVVHEGWTVRAGQMVGTLEPGAETAGRLYVELRRRGVPVDPLTWIAAGQDKVRS